MIDYHTYANTKQIELMKGPVCGYTALSQDTTQDYRIYFGPADAEMGYVEEKIPQLLEQNGLALEDIKGFFLSQYAEVNVDLLTNNLHLPTERVHYIGHKYGYTGASSPFLAYHEAVMNGKISKGDTCLFWTLGAGSEHVFVIFRN